jgi:hypothetical protein
MTCSQPYMKVWLDQQQMAVIKKRVSFMSYVQESVQESLHLLDTKPSFI